MERLSQGNGVDIPQKIVYLLVHWDLEWHFHGGGVGLDDL